MIISWIPIMISCNTIHIKTKKSEAKKKVYYVIPDIKKVSHNSNKYYWNMKYTCPPGMSIGEIEFKYGRAESVACYTEEKK